MPEAEAGEQIREEFERVVSVVEEMTGLRSRWNGEVRVVQPQEQLLAGQVFKARIDWQDFGISLAAGLAEDDLRWRTLIHEALHTVSGGLNDQDYRVHRGWEEATIETVQREIRPEVLARLGVAVPQSAFARVEATWPYEHYVAALGRLATEFMPLSLLDFGKALLSVPLRDRKAYLFAWGKRTALDFERYKRVYAEASGVLSR